MTWKIQGIHYLQKRILLSGDGKQQHDKTLNNKNADIDYQQLCNDITKMIFIFYFVQHGVSVKIALGFLPEFNQDKSYQHAT